MDTVSEPLVAVQELLGAFNAGDRDRFRACLADDAEGRTVDGHPLAGGEAVAKWLWSYRTAFPDIHVELLESVVSHDRGAFIVRSTGTQGGDLTLGTVNLPAAGRTAQWDAAYFLHVAGRRVTKMHIFADSRQFNNQLDAPDAAVHMH